MPRPSHLLPLAFVLLAFATGCGPGRDVSTIPARPDLAAWPASFAAALTAAEDATDFRELGLLYHANGFLERATACYAAATAAADLDPKLRAHLALDRARLQGDPVAEERALVDLLAQNPADAITRLQLADLRYKQGRHDAARADYAAVPAGTVAHGYATIALARDDLARGETDAAFTRLQNLVTAEPGWSSAHSLLAGLHETRGDSAAAESARHAARARKDPPLDDPFQRELETRCFDLARLSVAFEESAKSGDGASAARIFARMETVDPAHWRVHRFRAVILGRQDQPAAAARAYEAALAAGAPPETIHPPLVAAWRQAGDPARAAAAVATALEALPRAADLWAVQAVLQRDAGDAAAARTSFERALQVDPNHLGAHRELAQLLWARNDHAAALPHLEAVRRLDPADFAARAMLGQTHLAARQWQPAASVLAEAVALQPANPQLLRLLALATVRSGDRSPFAAVASSHPDRPELQLIWGDVLAQFGDRPAAEAAWRLATDHLPPNADPALRAALTQRLP